MYTHPCIKCSNQYQDTDPDPYYCSPCNEERKAIADTVNRSIGSRPKKRKVMSALQEYDAAQKVRGFMQVRL